MSNFINNVMMKINEKESKIFKKKYNEAMKIDSINLFHKLKNKKMKYSQYHSLNINYVLSSGCNYFINDGLLSGCSMCNYHSDNLINNAYMRALREKNIDLYSKIFRRSFENRRGIIKSQTVDELIASHNFFCDIETPESVYKEFLLTNNPYKIRPFRYCFEARASDLTREKLIKLKKYLGKGRAAVEVGVEVCDNWIRNFWLNKKITNNDIINAFKLLKEFNIISAASILIGIPLLTERQSIDIFIKTLKFLSNIGIDYYTLLILNRKHKTLQGFSYKKLKNNKRLKLLGISQNNHTGVPWLFTSITALVRAINEIPNFSKKAILAQYRKNQILLKTEMAYNKNKICKCNKLIWDAIEKFNNTKDPEIILNTFNIIKKDPCYEEYLKLLEKQKNASSIQETLLIVGEELAKSIWKNEWKKYDEQFKKELSCYKY